MKKILYLFVVSVLAVSCFDSDNETIYKGAFDNLYNNTFEEELTKFNDTIEKYDLSKYQDPKTGLVFIPKKTLGDQAAQVTLEDTLLVAIRVKMLEDTTKSPYTSYKTSDNTVYVPVNLVIKNQAKGLQEMFTKMKVGEEARAVMASNLLFGSFSNSYRIPQYASTIWDVKILEKAHGNYNYAAHEKHLLEDYFKKYNQVIVDSAFVPASGTDAKSDSVYAYCYFHVEKAGAANLPDSGDVCKVNYIGTYWDGTEFDTSVKVVGNDTVSRPMSFYQKAPKGLLDGFIEGFYDAVSKVGEGGKVRVGISSDRAYKNAKTSKIYNYNPIFFEIDVLEVEKKENSN